MFQVASGWRKEVQEHHKLERSVCCNFTGQQERVTRLLGLSLLEAVKIRRTKKWFHGIFGSYGAVRGDTFQWFRVPRSESSIQLWKFSNWAVEICQYSRLWGPTDCIKFVSHSPQVLAGGFSFLNLQPCSGWWSQFTNISLFFWRWVETTNHFGSIS